jgi:hypothetical protein
MQKELNEILHRIKVKMMVGVLQKPSDSYEWTRALFLFNALQE